MSILDRASREQIEAFKCDRGSAEIVFSVIQSQEYKISFERFISYVINAIEYLSLELSYGECDFILNWKDYKDLFPFDIDISIGNQQKNDRGIQSWIETVIIPYANLGLKNLNISISTSPWREGLLSFCVDEQPSYTLFEQIP